MIHRLFIMVGVLLTHLAVAAERPNVLMISVDDMNDWTSVLGGYAGKVHTPNLERLAKRAVNFTPRLASRSRLGVCTLPA